MKKSWLTIAVLLVMVVALGWFVYLKPGRDEPMTYPLSALKAGEVRQIRLDHSGGPAIALENKGDLWLITAPFSAHADPFQVQRMLAILGAKSSHRFAATDLARFDLDSPQMRLTIDGQTFSFGAVSAVAPEQYVLTAGAVFAIEPRYGAALPTDATSLIRRRLLAAGEVPTGFDLNAFSVTQRDGKWTMTPASADLSQDDFNRWVDEWRQATALRAKPYDKRKPQDEVTIELKDGRKLALVILQREPELALLRLDENLRYDFPAGTAKRLLTPPGENQRAVSSER